jgi:hypothetical protein
MYSTNGENWLLTDVWEHPDDPEQVGITFGTDEFGYSNSDYYETVAMIMLREPDGDGYHYVRLTLAPGWGPWML